jgi:hypothetical protein
MSKILPQANDLDKVIDVLIYIHYHPGCNYAEIAEYIGFTERQAKYYVDACEYLELIVGKRRPSAICEDIFKNTPENVTERVYEKIITDNLMGQVFAKIYVLPDTDIDSFARELVSCYHPEIVSASTIERRAHNIVLWCKRIINYMNLKHK